MGTESLQGTAGIRGCAMTPLMALFSLGLSVSTGLPGQAGTLPRPTLWAEPDSVAPLQSSMTLWCRGILRAQEFHLVKEGNLRIWDKQVPLEPGDKAKFSVPIVTGTYAGTYRCYYLSHVSLSDHSDPLELVVTGNYIKPSLSALPSPVVASGETVTLRCGSEQEFDRFILTQEGDPKSPQILNSHNLSNGQRQALFSVGPVLPGRRWSFQCYGHYSNTPQLWSHPSDTLQLFVSGPPENPASLPPRPVSTIGGYNRGSPSSGPKETQSPESEGPQGSRNLLICVTVISVVLLTLLLFLILYRQYSGRCSRSDTSEIYSQPEEDNRRNNPNRQDEDPQEVIYDQVKDTGLRQGVGPCPSHQELSWVHRTEGQMKVDKQVATPEASQKVTYMILNQLDSAQETTEPSASLSEEPNKYALLTFH